MLLKPQGIWRSSFFWSPGRKSAVPPCFLDEAGAEAFSDAAGHKGNPMKLALRRTVLFFSLLSLSSVPTALAGKPDQPTSVKDLKSYKFVVEEDDGEYTMRIKDKKHGVIGDRDSGFIKYRVATYQNKEIVQINMIKGVKDIRGVGKVLKKEVLRRYSKRQIRSDLVQVNRKELLKVWAKGYPHAASKTNGKLFRGVVPAMKFEGFDYTVTAKPSSTGIGGIIELEMEPARKGTKGSIRIVDPVGLDKILATTEPKLIPAGKRPKSAKQLKKEKRKNEALAKKAGDELEDIAEDVSDEEGVDESDLLEHLWGVMDDECGRGGRDGSGWAEGCDFTSKGGTYRVEPKDGGSSFKLEDKMEDEAEDFVDDNT